MAINFMVHFWYPTTKKMVNGRMQEFANPSMGTFQVAQEKEALRIACSIAVRGGHANIEAMKPQRMLYPDIRFETLERYENIWLDLPDST